MSLLASVILGIVKLLIDLFIPERKETADEAVRTTRGPNPRLKRLFSYLEGAPSDLGENGNNR